MPHTPIPWSTDGAYVIPRAQWADKRPGTLYVALCGISSSYRPAEETAANARFICNAVNHHAKLIAACKELLEICRVKCGPHDERILPEKTNENAMIDALTVLSEAETTL